MYMEEGRESPTWALVEAIKRLQARREAFYADEVPMPQITRVPRYAVRVLAEHIARHEKPPVDPDVLAVREITYTLYEDVTPERRKAYLAGEYDDTPSFHAALATYRKHKQEKTDD